MEEPGEILPEGKIELLLNPGANATIDQIVDRNLRYRFPTVWAGFFTVEKDVTAISTGARLFITQWGAASHTTRCANLISGIAI